MSVVRRGYADTRLGQVHFRTAGSRHTQRLPIVLLHQTASSSAMYEPMMELLSGEYFLFAPDTPGFGETEPPGEPASIGGYARVIHEALGAAGIGECYLFGHHTGASIAVQLVHDHPRLARKMILSGPPYLTPAQKEALKAKTEPIVLDAEGAYLAKLWARLRAKDPDASLALIHREATLTMIAGERYHEAYDAVFGDDFEAKLAQVPCPTLVVSGDQDTLSASLEPACAALKKGTMRRIPGGTTYVCERQTATVTALVREFFAD